MMSASETCAKRCPWWRDRSAVRDQANRHVTWLMLAIVPVTLLAFAPLPRLAAGETSREISLDGAWRFRRAEPTTTVWKTIHAACSFETHEGVKFDGVGIYRKSIPVPPLPPNMRAVLRFQAVATQATVFVNGRQVGTHLGGWTPFHVDITSAVRQAEHDEPLQIEVRVDEKVGHNSQGFLPVFAPHFGGMWQDVRLLIVPSTWIDTDRILAIGDSDAGEIKLDLPLLGAPLHANDRISVRYRPRGTADWTAEHVFRIDAMGNASGVHGASHRHDVVAKFAATYDAKQSVMRLRIPVADWRWWSPADPTLYEVAIQLELAGTGAQGTITQKMRTRAAFRSVRTDKNELLLNGRPIVVRGLLNWGYAPPLVAPSTDEAHMRRELQFAKSHGFNLMKFCLWVPPRRYLELADELGMLTWMEYPTWHSKWTADQLEPLRAEFREFFFHDRNHPSVILRSLTCETGPSADLGVLRALYDQCHAMVPHAVVEDDSSWIGWNRISDFYDDHPYGNNHTWVATLERLKQTIRKQTPKPLVLGEAIAGDTWTDPDELLRHVANDRPFWLPRFLDGNKSWLEKMRANDEPVGCKHLLADSKRYALLMRKYQIEAYRREVPAGGYVVSVIRDIPLCSMGLIDYLDRPKWQPADWSWQRDTMLLLATDHDRRCFTAAATLTGHIAVSHFGPRAMTGVKVTVAVRLADGTRIAHQVVTLPRLAAGRLTPVTTLAIPLPAVKHPTAGTITAELTSAAQRFANHWPIWIVPEMHIPADAAITCHRSCSPAVVALLKEHSLTSDSVAPDVIVAQHFDPALLQWLRGGGRVLMLPDGKKGSFPLRDVWFLRGGPYISESFVTADRPRRLLVELQHFDLAGSVVPDIQYVNQVDPWFMLWQNHELDEVQTPGLVFQTGVGKGKLIVSALRHTGPANSAGRWLLGCLLQQLVQPSQPHHALAESTVDQMRAKLDARTLDLTHQQWRFRPDPKNNGLAQHWQMPDYDDHRWKPIRVGVAWEGAGYPKLDGWAWYRLTVRIPKSWRGRTIYFCIEGADDYYEVYVNGKKAGSGGDIAKRQTAFELHASHAIQHFVQPGTTATIAVRVFDWYGAGGLFRPIYLSTAPIPTGVKVLE